MKKFINKVKRGFTLVELAIVIAVIAILIAVLVPTFIALIDSANESADKQMIKNINTTLVTEDIISGINTPSEALDAVAEVGYTLEKLTPTSEDNYIVYDQTTKTFALLDSEYNTLYSYNNVTIDPESPATWWIVSSESEMTSTTRSYILTGDIASTATETTASTSGVSLAKASVSGNKTAQTSSVKLEKDSSGEGYVLTYTGFGGINTYNVTSNISKIVYNLTDVGKDSAYKGWYNDNDFVINIDISATKIEINTSVAVVINSHGAEDTVIKVTAENDVSVTVKDYSGAQYVDTGVTLTSATSSTVNTITSTAYDNASTSNGTLELGTEKYPYLIDDEEDFVNLANYSNAMINTAYYFKLTNDIDLSSYNSTAFTTNFQGVFDGDGHSISLGSCNVIASYTYNNATFKNFTLIETKTKFSPVVNYTNYYTDRQGTVIFDNISVKSGLTSGIHETPGYGYSVFCACVGGTTIFNNCANYLSYKITNSGSDTLGAYAGIFVGNYAFSETTAMVSFINCVNYGTVTGDHVGFLFGNNTQACSGVVLVDSSDYVNTDTEHAAIYVSGCANYGMISGTAKVELVMSLGTSTVNDNVNATLSSDKSKFYNGGAMITSNIDDMSLSLNSSNEIVISASDNESVASYTVTFGVSTGLVRSDGSNGGSWYFSISETVTAANVSSATVNYIKNIMLDTDYDKTAASGKTYSELATADGELTSDQSIKYILVAQSDGSYIAVINSESAATLAGVAGITCGTNSDCRISCSNENGVTIGAVSYTLTELEAKKS